MMRWLKEVFCSHHYVKVEKIPYRTTTYFDGYEVVNEIIVVDKCINCHKTRSYIDSDV